MSISSILNIAKNAMFASQVSLQTTSHNISNVNTEGYSRQSAIYEEESPDLTSAGFVGNGATVRDIIRYYDRQLEANIADKNTSLQEQAVYAKGFTRIESIFNEDNSQLSANITAFFNNWHELTLDPTSSSVKGAIASSGESLALVINSMYYDLKDLQMEFNSTVNTEIDDVNRITSSIASLNMLIFEGGVTGGQANDYIDQRNQLIKELSGKVDIITFEDGNGRTTILTAGVGKALVEGNHSWDLSAITDEDTGMTNIGWKDDSGNVVDITDLIQRGTLKATVTARDEHINGFIEDLDGLAKSLTETVNYLHQTGNDNAGIPFFKPVTSNYAQSIAVSDQVRADSDNVMASSTLADSAGNDLALKIAALGEAGLIGGTSASSNVVAGALNLEGNILLNGRKIAVSPANTLNDLATAVTAASIPGVSATVSGGKLVLTADGTGITLSFLNLGRDEGGAVTSKVVAGAVGVAGSINLNGTAVSIASTDDLTAISNAINAAAIPGVTASITGDGRLRIAGARGVRSTDDISLLNGIICSDNVLSGIGLKGSSYSSKVAGAVNDIGQLTKGAEDLSEYYKNIMSMMEAQREDVSGVSLDEEMANLIKFQRAYQAAARLFTIADELMQTLLKAGGV